MDATDSTDKKKGPRLLFIDNIRIFLICLVITTHSAVTYGGSGDWYYTEAGSDTIAPIILTMINSLNQSFFMGCFLFISAYFITGSLERKGTRQFVHDRLVRLGIPLQVWIIFINPLLLYLIRVTLYNFNGTLWESYADIFIPFNGFGLGPMWFVFFLLIATLAYVLWYTCHGSNSKSAQGMRDLPSFTSIIVLGIILGLTTFILRIFVPIGWTWRLFNFQFPFFPQYIAFFVLGICAAQHNWLEDINSDVGKKVHLRPWPLF
jgi:glucans biosynthesis protein C